MFLSLPDTHPASLVTTHKYPDPTIIKLLFCDFFKTFIFEAVLGIRDILVRIRVPVFVPLTNGSGSASPHPDPYQNITDPQH
jgi:hypothetical protein